MCGECGAKGRYDVGTVTLDPTVLESRKEGDDTVSKAIGFTGYFRCRKCNAGGPWELPLETLATITGMMLAHTIEMEDVPLVFGISATFDMKTFRYATEGEDHLKGLIDKEPERAFLWVRLGNLYNHANQHERAEEAYRRAIELDPKDIEAHGMLGQLLFDSGRPLEAVPHFHAVLNHIRDAQHVDMKLRRNLLHESMEFLLDIYRESNGQIDLLPTRKLAEWDKEREEDAIVLELREFDLGSEAIVDDLCDMFLEPPRRFGRGLFGYRKQHRPDGPNETLRRQGLTVPRNAPCPCGSGHKYKKCCGRCVN